MTMPKERQKLAMVAALLVWCVALLSYWIAVGSDRLAVGLLWNLFLASVPLVWSAAFRSAMVARRPLLVGSCFVLWLLFFPNAPYLLTDLIHFRPRPPLPEWLLLAILLSCAGAGTLLGYFSLGEIHAAVERKRGRAMGWLVVSGSLLLCGFGIYVGRFLRWNSWDALTRPWSLLRSVVGQFVDAGPHPHPVPVTLIFGGGLLLGYLALRVMALTMQAEPRRK